MGEETTRISKDFRLCVPMCSPEGIYHSLYRLFPTLPSLLTMGVCQRILLGTVRWMDYDHKLGTPAQMYDSASNLLTRFFRSANKGKFFHYINLRSSSHDRSCITQFLSATLILSIKLLFHPHTVVYYSISLHTPPQTAITTSIS